LLHRALSELGEVHLVLMTAHSEPSPDERRVLEEDFGLQAVCRLKDVASTTPWRMSAVLGRKLQIRLAKVWYGARIEYLPDEAVIRTVNDLHKRHTYDVIVSRYLRPVGLAAPESLAPVVVDVDDLPSEVIRSSIAQMVLTRIRGAYWEWWLRSMERVERVYINRCAHAWVAKASDAALAGDCPNSVLENIPFTAKGAAMPAVCPPNAKSHVILMVGSLSYPPNEKAVDHFLANCWGPVRAACPDARFRIVGMGMTEIMRSRWSQVEGVEPIGFVEDLEEEYAGAAFAICPLEEGGGSCIKVSEALLHGRTLVCTPFGARGLDHVLSDREAYLIAEDSKAFASACVTLLENPPYRDELARAGAMRVRAHFSYDAFARVVMQAICNAVRSEWR